MVCPKKYFICFILFFWSSGSIYADEPSRELTPADVERIAEQLWIKPDSVHMKRLLQSQYNLKDSEEYATLEEAYEKEDIAAEKKPIIQHVRGKKGLAFPVAEKIPPLIELTPEIMKSVQERHAEVITAAAHQLNVIPLPLCKESKTEKTPTGYKPENKEEDVTVFDMLFIEKDSIPLDPDEVFGRRVVVMPYDHKDPNGGAMAAKGVQVYCLPTRFRGTQRMVYRHQGLDAVKNYDQDANGEGELHEQAKRLLR